MSTASKGAEQASSTFAQALPFQRIQTVAARVYIGGGRRFFSRAAAYRQEAIARVERRYPCECDTPDSAAGYPGYTCDRHAWPTVKWATLVRRLARLLSYLDNRERELAKAARPKAKPGRPTGTGGRYRCSKCQTAGHSARSCKTGAS